MSEERNIRYLIVNGDDLGMSSGVNRGIVEAHRHGVLTSASLMVNRPAAEEAATLARAMPDLSVGLHLELEHEADLRVAIRQQVDHFERLMGEPPTHLDSHRDVHRQPDILRYALELARRLEIPLRGHAPVHLVTSFYGQWGGENHPEQVSVESLIRLLDTEVADGVTELVCHPGYADSALESSYASVREAEISTLCDPRVREFLTEVRVQLLSFRDRVTLLSGDPERDMRPSRQP